MARDIKIALRKKAEENNDLKLFLLANQMGSIDIWEYLRGYIKENNLGELKISNEVSRTLEQTFKANKQRAKKLEGWIVEESTVENPTSVEETILESYKEELALLDKYALLILCDFLGIK